MYEITRNEAADILDLSVRSVDRYIKSGKLRAKKKGKIVYISKEDIDSFLGVGTKRQEIITQQNKDDNEDNVKVLSKNEKNFTTIFDKLRSEITKKDEEIKYMSMRIGKMEEALKNSVSSIEFKKTKFLLEESRDNLKNDLDNTKIELKNKNLILKEEKKLNLILMLLTSVLLLVLISVWIIKI